MKTLPLKELLTLDQLREVLLLLDSPLTDRDLQVALFALLSTDKHRLTRLGYPPLALARQLVPLRKRLPDARTGTEDKGVID